MNYDVMDRVFNIYLDIMSGLSSGTGSATFFNTDSNTSYIEVSIKNGNQDLDMTQYKYILVVNKPDGTTYKKEYTDNADSSKLVIKLDSQLLSGVGKNSAQLYVNKTVGSETKTVTMVEFNYIVKKSNFNELAAESENVDALYTKLRSDVDYILENGVSGGSSENNTIVDVDGTSGNIQLTTDKYQYIDADGAVNLLFPIVGDSEAVEIHLFYTGSNAVTAGSPDLVWEEKPNITENSHIEFIFTKYKGFWLGRFINYSVNNYS